MLKADKPALEAIEREWKRLKPISDALEAAMKSRNTNDLLRDHMSANMAAHVRVELRQLEAADEAVAFSRRVPRP